MPQYRVTLRYKDGETRTTTVWADSAEDARKSIRRIAKAQLADSRSGHDKSAGMPNVVKAERA